MQYKPFLMPTPYFAIPLGLGATAIAWLHAAHLWQQAEIIGTLLGILAVVSWAIFVGLYVYKLFAFQEQVKDEYQCPVRFSFLALIFISTMLVGDLFYHWQFSALGEGLIWLGVIGQLVYAFWRIGSLWQGDIFKEEAVQPPFYLPAVATNFTSASSLVLLGYADLGCLFFGAGFFAWLVFEPVLLQRLRVNPLPAAAKGTIGIVLAPAFVGSSAYLALNGGEIDLLVKLMWGYGLLQLLFLLRIFPSLAKNGFAIGFWAFSFGLASMANGAVSFYHHSQLSYLAIFAFIFANLMIFLLIFGTLIKILKRQFWVK